MKIKLALLFSCSLLLLLALPLAAQDSSPSLTGTTWEWVQTVTPVETITANNPSRYQVVFMEDGSVAVTLDCNRGFGSYTADGQSIQVSLMGSTMAFCPEDSQADIFAQQLGNAAVYFFQDGNLFIDQAMDSGTMQFRPIAPSLTDVTWEWTGTTGSASGDVTAADPTRYSVTFHDSGEFSFQADCNVGNGTYTSSDDGSLTMAFGISTMAMCPPDSQDGVFKEQVSTAASYVLGDGVLDITLADGGVMHFRAAGTAPAPDASLLVGTTWQWIDLQMANVSEAVTPPEAYTIVFNADGSVNIQADCNTAFGQYTAADGSVTITVGGVTRAMCPPESRSQQFLDLLGQVTTYNVTAEGWLELFTVDGYRLTFQYPPAPQPTLTGTTWQWVQTVTPTETIVAVDPARYTITFNDDGSFAWQVDCNSGGGGFTMDAATNALTIGPGMMTLMGCPEDTQDFQFQQITNAVVYYFVDGNLYLELADGAGVMQLQAAPAPEPALTGTTWQWQQTVTPVETIVASDPASYTVLFNDDGSYALQADCNSGGGAYTVDGQSISIGPTALTMMACPEGSQDGVFLQQLSNAAIFFFQNGDLFIDQAMDSGTMQFSAAQ